MGRGADDDVSDLEPAAANGWEAVQHLRQPAAHRSSMRTSVDRASMDIQRALRSGNVTEAAILSSNASRVHILHDAGELGVVGCLARGVEMVAAL